MASSLSKLVNNLTEGIPEIKCKYKHDDKKGETCRIQYKDCHCFLESTIFKDSLTQCRCFCCNRNSHKQFDGNLKRRLFLIRTIFLTMIWLCLFYCCRNIFNLMNIWMIGKNSIKFCYLKRKIFTVTWKILLIQITHMQKEFVKISK